MDNNIYEFENRFFRLQINPELGARIVSLTYRGQEVLVQQSEDTLAFGSTLWPASKERLGWPIHPDIDRVPYMVETAGDTLVFRSTSVSPLGWRFHKKIWVEYDKPIIHARYDIENITDTIRSVAAWEVNRHPKGAKVICHVDTTMMPYKRLDYLNATISEDGYFYCSIPKSYAKRSQKVSFDGKSRWIAYVNDDWLIVRAGTMPLSVADFSPRGGELELYIDDDTDYVEIEIQGPYTRLAPGQKASLQTKWQLAPMPKNTTLTLRDMLDVIGKMVE
ncbi:DUF4380 domain-containing protein [Fulvivirgaceae bacterium BMA12]|uniref:Membrane protein insertase YidC n=1 Tax=Agaribacillus aureus TaxID=3051825 RepID=A0ABT8L7N9_9BACT|nr:DUF4380 domain-containing protein [Fulvivirgaceae bacterium BMA12]